MNVARKSTTKLPQSWAKNKDDATDSGLGSADSADYPDPTGDNFQEVLLNLKALNGGTELLEVDRPEIKKSQSNLSEKKEDRNKNVTDSPLKEGTEEGSIKDCDILDQIDSIVNVDGSKGSQKEHNILENGHLEVVSLAESKSDSDKNLNDRDDNEDDDVMIISEGSKLAEKETPREPEPVEEKQKVQEMVLKDKPGPLASKKHPLKIGDQVRNTFHNIMSKLVMSGSSEITSLLSKSKSDDSQDSQETSGSRGLSPLPARPEKGQDKGNLFDNMDFDVAETIYKPSTTPHVTDKEDADKPSTKSVFKTDLPQENKDVTQAISNDFISKKTESSEDAKLVDAILESKCDVKSSHESESAAMKPSVERNLEEPVLDISNKPVISETLNSDMKKENTDFLLSDKKEKKDISPSKVKKSLSVPQEISKVQGEVTQPSLSDTVSDSNKGSSEEAMEGTNLDDSCDKQSEEKIGALHADEDSQKSTDSERKRQHDVESLSDAEGSQPLKRTRLDMVIGKLGERISIPPEVVESESFEYDDSNQGDSESVEKQSEEISASASEDEDDRTSVSSSKTLRLTNKDLEALVRSKVKAYLARQQSAELRALQARVDELLQAQEEWRKKTKELEHQVLDLTVLQQRLEKRKAHTAALRSITTRNFGIQVNEEKLKSNTPQKSTPKTPPTTNSTLLPASNLVVWTAPPYGQPGMSPTNTAVSAANKVTTVTIGQNLGSRNTSVAQLLSHTARMPTASTSVTTTKPTPVPISNSATKAQSAVAVPASPARSLLDQSGTASNLSKVTGAVTHPTSLVLVNASTGLPVVSKGAATTTILTAPVGSTPSPSNGIKVIDLTMEDDPNIVRQAGKQVVVSSGSVRNMVPQQVVRQIAPLSQHMTGTSILLSSPAGTQIMGTQGMPRTPGMYQVVTIPNAQNLRPGSLVTVLPGQTNVVRQPAPAVTTTNAVRPQPPPLLTQGPSSMTIMRPAQVIGVSSAVRPTIVSQPTTTAQMLLTGAALSSGSTAAVQQDTSPTLSSSKLTKVAPRLHPAPLPPAVTRNIPGERKPPPPQPGLKISRVKQGIVLSWNMYLPDDGTEVSSYQLYAYQETNAPPQSSLWKKVGDVKALPLPMACTLTQFQEGNKYHFAVRAVDIHGRTGLFSEPAFIFLNKGS